MFAGPRLCVAIAGEVTSPPGGIAAGGDITNSVVNIYSQNPEIIKRLAEVLDRSTQDRAAAEAKAADLARQLDQSSLTAESILGFLRILSRQPDIKTEDVPTKMAEITSQYLSMQKRLAANAEQDSSVADLMRQAASEMNGGRFEVADRLLDQAVKSASSSHVAKLEASRGDIALVQLHYSKAADLFANAAKLAPPSQRGGYVERQAAALYALGDEGADNAALRESIAMHRRALQELTRERAPLDWAAAENDLGNALAALGSRESGTAHLQDAVAAHRLALEERTRERVPLYWAQTQSDLADALVALGARESGTTHLMYAIAAYRAALEEQTQERVPLDRARTENKLAKTLAVIDERERGVIWWKIRSWVSRLTGGQVFEVLIGLLALGWGAILSLFYWLNPARLVSWHEAFPEPLALEEASKALEKISFGAITTIGWLAKTSILYLGTSNRALDSWIAKRAEAARSLLTSRPTVVDRRIALDLPQRVDGIRRDEPWSELRRLMSRSSPVTMLISGPGGAGKTTLACKICRRALGMPDQPLLSTRIMLPLLIEAEMPEDAAKPNCLYPYLAGLLRSAINENRPISATLTRALLRSGRLLVVVDGLSERSLPTRQAFDPQRQGFEINRMIVTSRERELPGVTTLVETETIPTGALFDFIERYLQEMKEEGEGELPSDDRILDACGDLKRLLGETQCTPLLATMWAKEIGTPKVEVPRPRGVASLIESYIRRILLPAANGNESLVDRLTKDAAKIAERELGDRYQPGYVTRATALEAVRGLDAADPDRRLGLLEKSRLLESPSPHSDVVHIAPDPVAEHLVARLRTEELGGKTQGWSAFLRQLRKHGRLSEDFVAALTACAEDEVYGSAVPALVLNRLKDMRNGREDVEAAA